MSEEYREDTQGDNDSVVESTDNYIAELKTDDFIWADVLEEIGRFDNFSLGMMFTQKEWNSFSRPLQEYIRAKRLIHKATLETVPDFILSKVDLEAKSMLDTNVTIRPRSSSKMEQQSVESGNEEIGSSMQKNFIELVKCEGRIWGNNDGVTIGLIKCESRIWQHK